MAAAVRIEEAQHPSRDRLFAMPERPAARSFRDLMVWRKAHEFVLAVYRLTESFPDRERFGLSQQMRRAAVSTPANIAEGFCKRSRAGKARFLNIAKDRLKNAATISSSPTI